MREWGETMRGMKGVLLLAAVLATPVGAQTQGAGERQAQAKLPQGHSALWATLRMTKIGEDQARGIFTATHPPAVKALVGKTVSLAGFVMPLDAATKGTHFLLSKYTPVCAFCPPGGPNEVVEVTTARAIVYPTKLVTVTGQFALENNGDNGLFFKMAAATVR